MNADSAAAAAAGCRIISSYRSVTSCSADSRVRSLAISRMVPRQRMAHFPATDDSAHRCRSGALSTPSSGWVTSASRFTKPGRNHASAGGSVSIPATTSRPSRTICTRRASGNASTSESAQ